MAISHCYWHLVVRNGNFTLLLTTSSQEWQFHTATEIYWSRCLGTQIWQMNLLSPMDPQHLLARLVLGRWTFFCQWTPHYKSTDALNTSAHNLADEPTLANGLLQYQSRDALNTSTQYFADEPTLPNGPPKGNRAEMPSHCYWHLDQCLAYWSFIEKTSVKQE